MRELLLSGNEDFRLQQNLGAESSRMRICQCLRLANAG